MYALRAVLLTALALFLSAPALHAQESGPAQGLGTAQELGTVLELSTDMLRFDQPSSRLFLGWHRDLNAMLQAGLDGSEDLLAFHGQGKGLQRLGLLAVFAAADAVASRAFSLTAHDAAHMEAAFAIGASRAYLVHTSDPSVEMSVGEFFLEAFDPVIEPGLYTYTTTFIPTPYQAAAVAEEGLDTNLVIAASISTEIADGNGHVLDLAPYALNKLWGIGYFMDSGPTSDAAEYLFDLGLQGFGVTAESVIALQAASFLASGGFLALARSVADFAMDDRSRARPLALHLGEVQIFWPEVTTWLNPDAVSVQLSTRVRWGAALVSWAGIDVPALGAGGAPELTLGSWIRVGAVRLEGEITDRAFAFPFLRGSVELRVGKGASIGVEGFYGRGSTMRERREYPMGPGASAFLRTRL